MGLRRRGRVALGALGVVALGTLAACTDSSAGEPCSVEECPVGGPVVEVDEVGVAIHAIETVDVEDVADRDDELVEEAPSRTARSRHETTRRACSTRPRAWLGWSGGRVVS